MAGSTLSPSLFAAAAVTPRRPAGRAGFDDATDMDGAILDGVAAAERCMFFFRGGEEGKEINKQASEQGEKFFSAPPFDRRCSLAHTELAQELLSLFPILCCFSLLPFNSGMASTSFSLAPRALAQPHGSSGAAARRSASARCDLFFSFETTAASASPCSLPRRSTPSFFSFSSVCSFSRAHLCFYSTSYYPFLFRPSSSVTWTAPKIWTPRSERR